MEYLVHYFLVIPVIGYLIGLCIPSKNEFVISRIAFITLSIQLVFALGFTCIWIISGHKDINLAEFSIYKTEGYDFLIDLYFDRVSALFLLMGAFLTFLV